MAISGLFEGNVYLGEDEEAKPPSALSRWYHRWGDLMLGSTAVILFLSLWEWAGTSGAINPLFTSAPSRVFNAFVKLAAQGELGHDVAVSSQEFIYGFGLAIIVGIPFGILMGWYRPFNAVLEPFVNFF